MEKKETFIEWCQHCDREVELCTVFKMQRCPNCKKPLKPCALCDLNLVSCEKCIL